MKVAEGSIGRVFVIRLEQGDEIPTSIEKFAAEKDIKVAQVIMISGIDSGSLVSGPRKKDQFPIDPIIKEIEDAHEMLALGLIAADEDGKPRLHIHGALARNGKVIGGCLRMGVFTWLVGEVVITEICGLTSKRLIDGPSQYPLLSP